MTTVNHHDALGGARGQPIWRSSLVLVGIPVPALLALVDASALQACVGLREGWQVYATYLLFVFQTAGLSAMVGWFSRRQPMWWGVLAWGVLLVDLQVFALAAPAWGAINKFGFAIASAQIGTLTCFGVLGATIWRVRLPLVGVGLVFTTTFALSLEGVDTWYLLLLFQCLATGFVCLVMRRFAFRIESQILASGEDAAGNPLQFSIRHLFYWTTGVAIAVGLGRFVGWQSLLSAGLHLGRTPELLLFVPLLTLTSVLAMWGALGREFWFFRLTILVVAFPLVGMVFGWSANGTRTRTWQYRHDNPFYSWSSSPTDSILVGVLWSVLAGTLLAGLLLVFRTSGHRLQRLAEGSE